MKLTDEQIEQLTILDSKLNDTEKETLIAFARALDSAEYKHNGEKFKEIRSHSVKILIRLGLLIKHPSGTMTYQISKAALLYYIWKIEN